VRGFGVALMRFDGVSIAQNDFFYTFNATLRGAFLATLSSVFVRTLQFIDVVLFIAS
jgi:hypothetical protein